MRRREFIALLGGAASWPLAASAQQPAIPLIGYLGSTTPALDRPRLAAFLKRLGELGWVKGRNVAIELRWAEGRAERAREVAAEFVRLKVDIFVTAGTIDVLIAEQATTSIPIVFAAAGDPVGAGLVASLARPGGSVTGLSLEVIGTAAKRLALLHELVPTARRLAIMGNVTNRSVIQEISDAQAAARALGLDTVVAELRGAQDIDPRDRGTQKPRTVGTNKRLLRRRGAWPITFDLPKHFVYMPAGAAVAIRRGGTNATLGRALRCAVL